MPRLSRWAASPIVFLVSSSLPLAVQAQWQSNTGPAGAALGATVGGDVERYIRAMSLAGLIAPLPWGARPFGSDDLRSFLGASTTTEHPWRVAMKSALDRKASLGGMVFASANSGFPWGDGDGAMWQGRGATAAAGGAATLRWGRLTVVAAPVVFSAQNVSFPLLETPQSRATPYAEPLFLGAVDRPQRMGPRAYSRVDAGESTIRVQGLGIVSGISTASQGWGPGEGFPAILGPNAGGFPHVFLGTSGRGIRVPLLGRMSGRYMLGTLAQSAWSPVKGSAAFVDKTESGTRRIAVGLSISLMPAALPNLELGVTRFYHSPYEEGSGKWDAWSKPIEGVLKKDFRDRGTGPGDVGGGLDNQLASFFARWSFPSRGVEATFEYLRDDYSWDSRDLAQEPENNGAIMASVRAVTERTATRLSVLTFEFFSGDVSPIAQARTQNFLYANTIMRQGHTQRGQLLGTPIGVGSMTGQRVAWERFEHGGSWRAHLQRWRPRSLLSTDPELLFRAPRAALPNNHDWIIDGSVARSRYASTRALTLEAGLAWAGAWNFSTARSNFYVRANASVF